MISSDYQPPSAKVATHPFRKLFVEVVGLARELGLAKFGTLSIDGTKVRANASKRKAMTYRRIKREQRRLEAEIGEWLRRADEIDAQEDARYGEDRRGDEIPEELRNRKGQLAAIRAAKARLEAAQRAADDVRGRKPGQNRNPKGGRRCKRAYGEPDPKAQSNFTDPESGIMHTSAEGFQQCYNAQVTVDGEHQLIVATQVTANASDQGQGIAQSWTRLRRPTGNSRRQCWRIRTTATSGTWPNWRREASTGMWHSAERGRSWRRRRVGPPTLGANGSRKRPTGGSKRYWDFVGSASGDSARRKGSGTWCVWR